MPVPAMARLNRLAGVSSGSESSGAVAVTRTVISTGTPKARTRSTRLARAVRSLIHSLRIASATGHPAGVLLRLPRHLQERLLQRRRLRRQLVQDDALGGGQLADGGGLETGDPQGAIGCRLHRGPAGPEQLG